MSTEMSLPGLPHLAQSFRTADRELAQLLRKVVLKAAADIQARAQERAPVDTGNLRNSIIVQTDRSGSNALRVRTAATIGPTAAYGAHVEYGTATTRPQPYLTPATDEVLPGYLAALEQIGRLG